MGRAAAPLNARAVNGRSANPITPTRKDSAQAPDNHGARNGNGQGKNDKYDDIPENMYLPEQDEDPGSWIHRDKLAKIESEELQAAGINLANARSRSRTRIKSVRSTSSNETDNRREEKRQKLQTPAEIEDELERASWDLRLPEEIEEEAAAQMYSNPVLRKSGSKIPVMTSSPLPIPAERYERDTPVPRKRTASGAISIDGDLVTPKTKYMTAGRLTDDSDKASSVVGSSTTNSPKKARSKSINLASPPNLAPKKTVPGSRKVSTSNVLASSPSQRPPTRSGEQDNDRSKRVSYHAPEGDPPWLATMYKPDPMLPPDQQLIPTLAKKQMQAQWAAEGAVPKAFDREFTPIDVHTEAEMAKEESQRYRSPSPLLARTKQAAATSREPEVVPLKQVSSVRSNNGRPGTSGSLTGGYSTMPKVTNSAVRQQSFQLGVDTGNNAAGRSTTIPAPSRMQATNLVGDDDEPRKRGCCCTVM